MTKSIKHNKMPMDQLDFTCEDYVTADRSILFIRTDTLESLCLVSALPLYY